MNIKYINKLISIYEKVFKKMNYEYNDGDKIVKMWKYKPRSGPKGFNMGSYLKVEYDDEDIHETTLCGISRYKDASDLISIYIWYKKTSDGWLLSTPERFPEYMTNILIEYIKINNGEYKITYDGNAYIYEKNIKVILDEMEKNIDNIVHTIKLSGI